MDPPPAPSSPWAIRTPTCARSSTGRSSPAIEKPSRYLGSELHSVHKDPRSVDVRLALVFPDLYDLGLGNLGLHILYAVLNRLDWCWAERAYAPALDLEHTLRERGLPLFAWESKDPLGTLDGLGFTLQSELTYTNILNVIDLAGIPLRTEHRDDRHPLTFAGGPAVFNPEPLAPFMDFFAIGDGEELVVDIAETIRATRKAPRSETLDALARIDGVYVPARYPMEHLPDGRVLPPVGGPVIEKRTLPVLDGATFPTDYIVPYARQVHDRVSLEVLRGCTQGCRFCQAGMTTRPVRERSLTDVDRLMERTLEQTGYEEVSLVSLSTCDYSRVRQLVDQAARRGARDHVAISLPSLRLDSFSVDLADRVADVRRTGLTFAPEAASPRLRALINKWIPDELLLDMSARAYERGWKHVKLYFMIGLPTERDDDIEAIADLAIETLRRGREIDRKARVHTGVSIFVPKPFTPFQWSEQIDVAEANRRQAILAERFRRTGGGIKFGRHEPEETFLEGLVSRADRRAADVIEAAFRKGARFDAWSEHRDFSIWQEAIAETGFDAADALRARDLDERLPWDHIDVHVAKDWLRKDHDQAMVLEHAEDCRRGKCHQCGVIDRERDLCLHMLRDSRQGAKQDETFTPEPIEPVVEPDPVQRIRLRIGRTGDARLLSHLETQSAWIRALRRARAPLAYSKGFHPMARVQFSTALPVGEESEGDYLDVLLVRRVDPDALRDRLRDVLPPGFRVLELDEVRLREGSLMSRVEGFRYRLQLAPTDDLEARVLGLLSAPELPVRRRAKKRGRKDWITIDLRPRIESLSIVEAGDEPVVELVTRSVEGRGAKAREVLELLDQDPARCRVTKLATFLAPDPEPVELRVAPPDREVNAHA